MTRQLLRAERRSVFVTDNIACHLNASIINLRVLQLTGNLKQIPDTKLLCLQYIYCLHLIWFYITASGS